MRLQELDPSTRALIALAGAIATGSEPALEARCRQCLSAQVSGIWMDELMLQSVLIVGWPRAMVAFAMWRRIGPPAAADEDATSAYSRAGEWRARGEAVCREVYGKNYERLRQNVRGMHPSLDAWMITEGYGKVLGRPGLDLARRELCIAAQVAIQGAEPQLHSHLRGALNAGASVAVVSEVLEIVAPLLGPEQSRIAASLWARIRR